MKEKYCVEFCLQLFAAVTAAFESFPLVKHHFNNRSWVKKSMSSVKIETWMLFWIPIIEYSEHRILWWRQLPAWRTMNDQNDLSVYSDQIKPNRTGNTYIYTCRQICTRIYSLDYIHDIQDTLNATKTQETEIKVAVKTGSSSKASSCGFLRSGCCTRRSRRGPPTG